MRLEIRRFTNWLEREQVEYWKQQLKLAREELAEARNALFRKSIGAKPGETPRATEEKVAVQKAERRVEEAERKLRIIQKWCKELEREILLYEGRARQLGNFVESDAKSAIAQLERMLDALDAYLRVAPPVSAPGPAFSSTGGSATAAIPTPAMNGAEAVPADKPPDAISEGAAP
jgi:hypothetical protein